MTLMGLFDTFDNITREAWLEKIAADLKERNIGETIWHIDSDLDAIPFVHAEDLGDNYSGIPFPERWEIGEIFDVRDEKNANRRILEALEGGCESVVITCAHLPDWGVLLDQVQLDLINTTITPLPPVSVQESHDSFRQFVQERSDDSLRWAVRSEHRLPDSGNAQLVCRIPDAKPVVQGLVKGMESALSATGISQQMIFICPLGPLFLVEVARIRALKILWYNIQQALGVEVPVPAFVEAQISPEAYLSDPHQNIIRAGSIALSAICGGADRLIIRPAAEDNDPLYRRIARNMHHIFRYESKLDDMQDPVQGAYYIEALTRKMTDAVWDRLISKLEEDGR